jgi:hypothetical protein
VVEQVSGWAGFGDPHRFVAEHLRVSWAVGHLHTSVTNGAFTAADVLRRRDLSALADEFSNQSIAPDGTVNLKRFLEVFPDILHQLAGEVDDHEQIRHLIPLLATPVASAEAVKRLLNEFDRREGRRRRTRNALVHGGPVAERTVDATVDFAETLATHALGTSIDGRLSGQDLIDHFLEHRARLETVEHRLRNGDPLSEALFWGQPTN